MKKCKAVIGFVLVCALAAAFIGGSGKIVHAKKKSSGYTKMDAVNESTKKSEFLYQNTSIEIVDYKDNGGICYYVTVGTITNLASESRKPNLKICFYDKNKKKLGTYEAAYDEGMHLNITLQPNGSYDNFMVRIPAEGIGIKNPDKVVYFKILACD